MTATVVRRPGTAGTIAWAASQAGVVLPVRVGAWGGSDAGPPAAPTVGLVERTGPEVLGAESLRSHYVRTIRAWLDNLERNLTAVAAIIGAERARLWRLYLAGGALAFEEARMGVDQILAVRRG